MKISWGWMAVLAMVLAGTGNARADMFKWVDDQGNIHFEDSLAKVPPDKRKLSKDVEKDLKPANQAPAPGGVQPGKGGGAGGGHADPEWYEKLKGPQGKFDYNSASREEILERLEHKRSKVGAGGWSPDQMKDKTREQLLQEDEQRTGLRRYDNLTPEEYNALQRLQKEQSPAKPGGK